ncbi:GNAT family N-acetyltransferase [Clostridium perfringens]|uniref:GNAT family N-acetyltransferase n=1 Tax=Clostridium perfringens TaxID=1502 RepID=UPI00350E5896
MNFQIGLGCQRVQLNILVVVRRCLFGLIENRQVRGFIALKETSPYTLEIYVMGVLKEFHRYKIGTNLFKACYEYAKEHGYLYMQVKTVKEGCYDVYDRTNTFYKKIGFKEFECFPILWDECNPCQVYIMSIN